MGIDHSNPYIHSTTVLCDMHSYTQTVQLKAYLLSVDVIYPVTK